MADEFRIPIKLDIQDALDNMDALFHKQKVKIEKDKINIRFGASEKDFKNAERKILELEERPTKVDILLDTGTLLKLIEELNNNTGKEAIDIGRTFAENIRIGLGKQLNKNGLEKEFETYIKSLDIRSAIKAATGNGKYDGKGIQDTIKKYVEVLSSPISEDNYMEIVKLAEALEDLRDILNKIRADGKEKFINLKSNGIGDIDLILTKIEEKYKDIGQVLASDGNIKKFLSQISSAIASMSGQVDIFRKQMQRILLLFGTGNGDSELAKGLRKQFLDIEDTIKDHTNIIEGLKQNLAKAISGETSVELFNKAQFKEYFSSILKLYSDNTSDLESMTENQVSVIEKYILDVYQTYVLVFNNNVTRDIFAEDMQNVLDKIIGKWNVDDDALAYLGNPLKSINVTNEEIIAQLLNSLKEEVKVISAFRKEQNNLIDDNRQVGSSLAQDVADELKNVEDEIEKQKIKIQNAKTELYEIIFGQDGKELAPYRNNKNKFIDLMKTALGSFDFDNLEDTSIWLRTYVVDMYKTFITSLGNGGLGGTTKMLPGGMFDQITKVRKSIKYYDDPKASYTGKLLEFFPDPEQIEHAETLINRLSNGLETLMEKKRRLVTSGDEPVPMFDETLQSGEDEISSYIENVLDAANQTEELKAKIKALLDEIKDLFENGNTLSYYKNRDNGKQLFLKIVSDLANVFADENSDVWGLSEEELEKKQKRLIDLFHTYITEFQGSVDDFDLATRDVINDISIIDESGKEYQGNTLNTVVEENLTLVEKLKRSLLDLLGVVKKAFSFDTVNANQKPVIVNSLKDLLNLLGIELGATEEPMPKTEEAQKKTRKQRSSSTEESKTLSGGNRGRKRTTGTGEIDISIKPGLRDKILSELDSEPFAIGVKVKNNIKEDIKNAVTGQGSGGGKKKEIDETLQLNTTQVSNYNKELIKLLDLFKQINNEQDNGANSAIESPLDVIKSLSDTLERDYMADDPVKQLEEAFNKYNESILETESGKLSYIAKINAYNYFQAFLEALLQNVDSNILDNYLIDEYKGENKNLLYEFNKDHYDNGIDIDENIDDLTEDMNAYISIIKELEKEFGQFDFGKVISENGKTLGNSIAEYAEEKQRLELLKDSENGFNVGALLGESNTKEEINEALENVQFLKEEIRIGIQNAEDLRQLTEAVDLSDLYEKLESLQNITNELDSRKSLYITEEQKQLSIQYIDDLISQMKLLNEQYELEDGDYDKYLAYLTSVKDRYESILTKKPESPKPPKETTQNATSQNVTPQNTNPNIPPELLLSIDELIKLLNEQVTLATEAVSQKIDSLITIFDQIIKTYLADIRELVGEIDQLSISLGGISLDDTQLAGIGSALDSITTANLGNIDAIGGALTGLRDTISGDTTNSIVTNLNMILGRIKAFMNFDMKNANIFSTIKDIVNRTESLQYLLGIVEQPSEKIDSVVRGTRTDLDDYTFNKQRTKDLLEYVEALKIQNKANHDVMVSTLELYDDHKNLEKVIVSIRKKNEEGGYIQQSKYLLNYAYNWTNQTGKVMTYQVDTEQYEAYWKEYISQYQKFISEYNKLQSDIEKLDIGESSSLANGNDSQRDLLDRFEFLKAKIPELEQTIGLAIQANDLSQKLQDEFNSTKIKFSSSQSIHDMKADKKNQQEIYETQKKAIDNYKSLVQQYNEVIKQIDDTIKSGNISPQEFLLDRMDSLRDLIKKSIEDITNISNLPPELKQQFDEINMKQYGFNISRENKEKYLEELALEKMNKEAKVLFAKEAEKAKREEEKRTLEQEAEMIKQNTLILIEAYKKVGEAIEKYLQIRERISFGSASDSDFANESTALMDIYYAMANIGSEGNYNQELEKQYMNQLNDKTIKNQTYSRLKSLVNQYNGIRKDIASGRLVESDQILVLESLNSEIEKINYSLINSPLYDKAKHDEAFSSFRTLGTELEKIELQNKKAFDKKQESDINKATTAINAYYNAIKNVRDILEQINSGNLDIDNANVLNRLRKALETASSKRNAITSVPFGISDETKIKMFDAEKLFRQYVGDSYDKYKDYSVSAASLFNNLINNAETYLKLLSQRDSGRDMLDADIEKLKILDERFHYVIDNLDMLKGTLSGDDVSLPDRLIKAMATVRKSPVMNEYDRVGKLISSYEAVDGNDNYKAWLNGIRNEYKQIQSEINSVNWEGNSEEELNNINEQVNKINTSLKKLESRAKSERKSNFFRPADEKDILTLDRLMSEWIRNNTAAKEAIELIHEYQRQLAGISDEGALDQIKAGFELIRQLAYEAGQTGLTFGDKLKQSMSNLGRYLLSFASYYRIIGVLRQGISVVKELDSALKEVKMVTDVSRDTLEKWLLSTYDVADKVGGTATEIQKSVASWIRLGCSESYSPTILRYIC